MIEVLVKEYGDGIFIVITKNKRKVILKKEFTGLIARDVMQKYVFSLMERMPETADEYVELLWIVHRDMNMAEDPTVFSRPD